MIIDAKTIKTGLLLWRVLACLCGEGGTGNGLKYESIQGASEQKHLLTDLALD